MQVIEYEMQKYLKMNTHKRSSWLIGYEHQQIYLLLPNWFPNSWADHASNVSA